MRLGFLEYGVLTGLSGLPLSFAISPRERRYGA